MASSPYSRNNSAKILRATEDLLAAFGDSSAKSSDIAHSLFPTRPPDGPQEELRRQRVDHLMDKLQKKRYPQIRTMQADRTVLRERMNDSDDKLMVLLECRMGKAFYNSKKEPTSAVQSPSVSSQSTASEQPSATPSSPFLRRSASRDPIHRDKIKEEVVTPVPPFHLSNGTPRLPPSGRLRTQSALTGQGFGGSYRNDLGNSMEKPSSAVNPMFQNSMSHKPPVSVLPFSHSQPHQYSSVREMKQEVTGTPPKSRAEPPPYRGRVPLSARTTAVPTGLLCREMRGALQGLGGMYFVKDGTGHLVISTTCSTDDSLAVVFNRLLELANLYIDVRRSSTSRGDTLGSNVMLEALLLSVTSVLDEYMADLDNVRLTDTTQDIHRLIRFSTTWRPSLIALQRCLAFKDLHSVDLASSLLTWYHFCLPDQRTIVEMVLEPVMNVFANSLKLWLTRGVLDLHQQWMIEASDDSGSDSTTFRTYKITRQPSFIDSEVADLILNIGVSLEHISLSEQEKFDKYRQMVDRELCGKSLYSTNQFHGFHQLLLSTWEQVGRSVVTRMMKDGKLIEHLKAARLFLLVDEPYFATALHQRFVDYTGGLRSTLSQMDASVSFLSAIASSPVSQAFPFKVVIDVISSSSDSPNTSSRMQFIRPLRPIYCVSGLISRIFRGTQEKYENLFHFIWAICMGMFSIEDATTKLRSLAQQVKASNSEAVKYLFRQLQCVGSLASRILMRIRMYTLDVVSMSFGRLCTRLQSVQHVEAANQAHIAYLDELATALFLQGNHDSIYGLITTLLQLSADFTSIVGKFEMDVRAQGSKQDSGDGPGVPTETLREFELEEKRILAETEIVGDRPVKARIVHTSLMYSLRQLSELVLPLCMDNRLMTSLIMEY